MADSMPGILDDRTSYLDFGNRVRARRDHPHAIIIVEMNFNLPDGRFYCRKRVIAMAIERAPGGTSFIDVLDRVLDKGIEIDA
jgi:hypothetical protein